MTEVGFGSSNHYPKITLVLSRLASARARSRAKSVPFLQPQPTMSACMLNTHWRRCIQVIATDGMYAGFAGAKTGHCAMALCGVFVAPVGIGRFRFVGPFTPFGWRHLNSVFAIRCEYSVKSSEVDSWLGYQRG